MNKIPESFFHLSYEHKFLIINKLGWGCFRCGWKESVSDMHHIEGRRIDRPHAHSNLTYLCPNCHRVCHRNPLMMKGVPTLEDKLPASWPALIHPTWADLPSRPQENSARHYDKIREKLVEERKVYKIFKRMCKQKGL